MHVKNSLSKHYTGQVNTYHWLVADIRGIRGYGYWFPNTHSIIDSGSTSSTHIHDWNNALSSMCSEVPVSYQGQHAYPSLECEKTYPLPANKKHSLANSHGSPAWNTPWGPCDDLIVQFHRCQDNSLGSPSITERETRQRGKFLVAPAQVEHGHRYTKIDVS